MNTVPANSAVGRRIAARKAAEIASAEAPSAPAEDKVAAPAIPVWVIMLVGFTTLAVIGKLVMLFPQVACIVMPTVAIYLGIKNASKK